MPTIMTTQTPSHTGNLSDINNLKDLKAEIARVKAVVKVQENVLRERAKQLPQEAAFAAVNGIIHVAVKKGVPGNVLNIVRNSVGLVMNIKKQRKGLQGVVTQAKEFVVYSGLTQALKLYQRYRQRKKSGIA
jgi:hypothetical protein